MIETPFIKAYEKSFADSWALAALTNYDTGKTFSYADVARGVARTQLLLKALEVKKGERVALIGEDCAEWCIHWLGIVTYGAVVVPILPAFTAEDVEAIINHSDAVVVFADVEHRQRLSIDHLPEVRAFVDIMSGNVIPEMTREERLHGIDVESLFTERYPAGFTKEDIHYDGVSNEDVVLLTYTSGTSGSSKGVMITANNLIANVVAAQEKKVEMPGDVLLCFLPNAHAFSLAFNVLLPLSVGGHVFILRYKPTPSILVKAMKEVRPHVILSVPLVLEKIYAKAILPKIEGNMMARLALKIPLLNKAIYGKVGDTLRETFGGRLKFFIVGGAALNDEVSDFLMKAGFPLTVGYGMTECAPLISYVEPKRYRHGSVGKIMSMIQEVRIAKADHVEEDAEGHRVGEIQVRGENVCKGYYKNPEATTALFSADGWLRTGDLGYFDKDEYLYISGRIKAMILTSNGENVYPEAIEEKYNIHPYVAECVVVQRGERLVAVVYPDYAVLEKEQKEPKAALEEVRKQINTLLNPYQQIAEVELREEDFERTPKMSVKRYLVK